MGSSSKAEGTLWRVTGQTEAEPRGTCLFVTQVLRRLRQEDQRPETRLGYRVRSCLKKGNNRKATQRLEAAPCFRMRSLLQKTRSVPSTHVGRVPPAPGIQGSSDPASSSSSVVQGYLHSHVLSLSLSLGSSCCHPTSLGSSACPDM